MFKAVIDTNIVISGIFFGGNSLKILNALDQGLFKVVLSKEIIDEYKDTIEYFEANKKKKAPYIESVRALENIIAKSDIVDITGVIAPPCNDPDDIIFLQTAIAGKAKYLVSGDNHLLSVEKYKGGLILNAKDFLDKLTG